MDLRTFARFAAVLIALEAVTRFLLGCAPQTGACPYDVGCFERVSADAAPWYAPRDAEEARLLAQWGGGDVGMMRLCEHRGEADCELGERSSNPLTLSHRSAR